MTSSASYPSLRRRPVLITGGASGIGACLVERFARQGARVAFLDRDVEAAETLGDTLRRNGLEDPVFVPCDLRDLDALRGAVAAAESNLGGFRVLINNAADDQRQSFDEVSPADWDDLMASNLRHQFFASQAVAPEMAAAGGGSILNLGSIVWMVGGDDMTCYATAKAAITGLTRSLARRLGPLNIRVNAILPGAIMTERQRRLWVTPEYEARILEAQCLPRLLEPDDVAALALFLAADDSSACTGHNYLVDGGWA